MLTLVMLAAAALASPWPGRAAPAETSRRDLPAPIGAVGRWSTPPRALDWLAELGLSAGRRPAVTPSAQQRWLVAAYAQLPLSFEANAGQSAPQVRFLVRGSGYTLFLTAGAEAVLAGAEGPVMRLALEGANPAPAVRALDERAAKSAYFIGNDPARWRTQVAHYGRVRFGAVYPGIDLVYYGAGRQLECDWEVAPGADPGQIRLRFGPGVPVRLEGASGDLLLGGAGQEVRLQKPVAYQAVEGRRVAVAARYALEAGGRVGLELGGYDGGRLLVIDPVLVYSTYLGGSGGDRGSGIAVDLAGNAYVTGGTGSADFPQVNPLASSKPPSGGNSTAFVSKLSFNPATHALSLAYSTYLGGSGGLNGGSGIAVDWLGNAYVTGFTESADFPVVNPLPAPNNKLQSSNGNAFVSKLSFNGSGLSLAYSTYLGGSGNADAFSGDYGLGIAVDWLGNAYVTGQTYSADFPQVNPLASSKPPSGRENTAFVSKLSFNPATHALSLAYSTYLGGSGGDNGGSGIAVDWLGNAYVTGFTESADFPTAHPLATNRGVGAYAFVSKLSFNPATHALSLAYSTYLGGGADGGSGIAVDLAGNAYVTGFTGSADFPQVNPLASNTMLRGFNAFVSKLRFDERGGALTLAYSTYLGGSGNSFGQGDFGNAIAVDRAGNAYVTGGTGSADFPQVNPLASSKPPSGGNSTAFVSKLSFNPATHALSLAYSTYLGGSGQDQGLGIAVDWLGNAYVTGFTGSADFPTAHPLASGAALRGGTNVFVVKLGGQ